MEEEVGRKYLELSDRFSASATLSRPSRELGRNVAPERRPKRQK